MWYNLDPSLQYNVLGGVYLGLIASNVVFAFIGFISATVYDLALCICYILYLFIKLFLLGWLIFYTTYFSLQQLNWIFSLIQGMVQALYILISILFAHALVKHGPPDILLNDANDQIDPLLQEYSD